MRPSPPPDAPPLCYSVAQVAVMLRVSVRWVQDRIARNQLPYRRLSPRKVVIPRQALEAYLAQLEGCSPERAVANLEEDPVYGR